MASHPSPFYRHRQSNKTLDPTGQTAKFLYTILKQLDLKNIDWNEVASSLDITNGHAARMRWSRFRAQIEGLDNSYSRRGGKKKDGEKKRKRKDKSDEDILRTPAHESDVMDTKRLKTELQPAIKHEVFASSVTKDVFSGFGGVKNEPLETTSVINGVTVHHPTVTTIKPSSTPSHLQSTVSDLPTAQPPVSQSVLSQPIRPLRNMTWKQPPISSNNQLTPYWLHQYHNTRYHQPSYRAATTPFFGSNANVYSDLYQYPIMYSNQMQQQYHYGSQMPQNQRATNCNQFSNNSAHCEPSGVQLKPSQSQLPFPTGSIRFKQLPIQTPEHNNYQDPVILSNEGMLPNQEMIEEKASQISYPWPYSEASLQQLVGSDANTQFPTADNRDSSKGSGNSEDAVLGGDILVEKVQSTQLEQGKSREDNGTANAEGSGIDLGELSSQEGMWHFDKTKGEFVNGSEGTEQTGVNMVGTIHIKAEPEVLDM